MLRQFSPALSILGVYHSHPAGVAEPSPTDIDEAMYPEWAYVIIGLEPTPTVSPGFSASAHGAVQENED